MFKNTEDLLALVLIVGCLALLFCGINGEIKGILALAAGWLFGKGYGTLKSGGKKDDKSTDS